MPSNGQLIEIVGVAGSGKSTVTRILRDAYDCHVADSLHTRLPAHWPYVLHSIPGLVPLVWENMRYRPFLSWDELKFVIYVTEWDRFLRAQPQRTAWGVVLDQGPIFALACLLWGRKRVTRSARFEAWLQGMLERWSNELDAIVLLDASDDTLLGRINEREQRHEAKGIADEDGLKIIGRHRQAYERVLDVVDALGKPRLLHFDSGADTADEIARELVHMLELRPASSATAPVAVHARVGET